MLRFVPLTLILLVVAGCGSSASSPSKSLGHVTPKVQSKTPAAGTVLFGANVTGHVVRHSTIKYDKLTTVAWEAHLMSLPGSKPLYIAILRLNAAKGITAPNLVWSARVPTPTSRFISGRFTAAQLTARHLKVGGQYEVDYVAGRNNRSKLASGYINLGKNSGSTDGGVY